LTGPEILAETSVMGFDPKIIIKGYFDKVEIIRKDQDTEIIQSDDPYVELKKLLKKSDMQEYRYLGGAVGRVNYDAIRLVEKIPNKHGAPEPLMEFGIYDDGILYDNVHKKLFYFYHEENRFKEFKISEGVFEEFNATETIPNMDKEKFSDIVNKAKQYIHDGDIFQVVLSMMEIYSKLFYLESLHLMQMEIILHYTKHLGI
jgi:anthranilate synthase component 1